MSRIGRKRTRPLKLRDFEAEAVGEGVAETVALSRARGQSIVDPAERRGPYRRQSGLDWLAGKGRIGPTERLAGDRYGQVWRRVRSEGAIPSSLDVRPGGGGAGGASMAGVLSHAEGTAHAQRKLAQFRQRLSHQTDLVAACDRICGEELTPREAAGGEREALRLEAVLKVALDLLVGG